MAKSQAERAERRRQQQNRGRSPQVVQGGPLPGFQDRPVPESASRRRDETMALPCPNTDQFYDEIVGNCAMCEDICRPHFMALNECQRKCPSFYREKALPATLLSTLIAYPVAQSPGGVLGDQGRPITTTLVTEALSDYDGGMTRILWIVLVCLVGVLMMIVLVGVIICCALRRKQKKLAIQSHTTPSSAAVLIPSSPNSAKLSNGTIIKSSVKRHPFYLTN